MAPCAGSGLAYAVSGGVIPGIRAGMIQFPELRSVFYLPVNRVCAIHPQVQ